MSAFLDSADVVVVGAGAAGAATAWRLATAGLDVVCVERGHWSTAEQAPQTRLRWEAERLGARSPSPTLRAAPADYPVLDDTSPIKALMFNGVGGSTVMWSAHTPRFRPSDFRVRSLDGVGVDWPVTYWDLAPYYEVNDAVMGVSGRAGDPANPPRTPRTTPPVPFGAAGARIAAAFDSLGWHWWPSDGALLTEDVDGRSGCRACGPCEAGCPVRARSSADVSYWPRALTAGARLVTGASVTRVLLDGPRRARGVEYRDEAGRTHVVEADAVVLAANGVGTARLLLASAAGGHPDGLGNSSGLLGRNLMLHPIAVATGVFADDVRSWAGNSAFCLLSQEFYESAPDRGFVRGYEMQVTRGQGPLVTALGGFNLDVPWGAGHHERFERLFGHVASLAITCEDLPDPDNRVVLDDSVTDSAGVPAARMLYRVDANSEAMVTHGLGSARTVLRAAGCTEVIESRLLPQAGFHLMGTARMGSDPATSVVDDRNRLHDVPNVLVVDGAAFATAAAVNPTPTIQALALRAADLLVATARAGAAV